MKRVRDKEKDSVSEYMVKEEEDQEEEREKVNEKVRG